MWEIAIERILIPIARSIGNRVYPKVRRTVRKEFSVPEITESLENGKLSFDRTFDVKGTFSEYVPFVDPATLVNTDIKSNMTGTCRIGDIVKDGVYLGALFPLDARKATEPAVPLLYSSGDKSRKIFSFSTGDQLELECQLVPLDYAFRNILYNEKYSCFNSKPFGLEVIDVYTKKPKKADEFVVDAFFLGSLEYEEGIDQLFSSLDEITAIWEEETGTVIPIAISVMLHFLHRTGVIKGAIARNARAKELIAYHDWIDKQLYRVSYPIDLLDENRTKQKIDEMKDHITHFSFVEKEMISSWGGIWTLLQGEFTPDQKELLSSQKWLAQVVGKLRNRADLLKAWEYFLEPNLNVDFQFDQVHPHVRQTINPRRLLKQRGFI